MKIRSLFYHIKDGLKNIYRNRLFSLASIATITACIFLFGVFYVLTNALQARGAATESLIVNISRQGLIYIPAMFILGAIFHEPGLIWAQPVADVMSLLLALVLYMRNSKRLTGKK